MNVFAPVIADRAAAKLDAVATERDEALAALRQPSGVSEEREG